MNSVLLLVLTAVVFGFGYRYYAKLLAADVFRPANKYSTPPLDTAERDGSATYRQQVIGHHLATLGAPVVVGVAVAAGWGWTPAFITLTIGAVLVSGVFGYALFWLAHGRPGASIAGAAVILSPAARATFFLLLALLLLASNGVIAVLAGRLLAFEPTAPLALTLLVPVALGLGYFGRGWLFAAVAVVLALVFIAWGSGVAVEFAGGLGIQVGEATVAVIDGVVMWVTLLFLFLFAAARLESLRLARPFGVLAAALLTVMVAVVVLGILVAHPTLTAPNFHVADAPPALPFVFAALAVGSLVGVYVLAATHDHAADLHPQTGPRRLGYGGALVSAGFAVVVLIASATAFDGTSAWTEAYPVWQQAEGLAQPVALALAGFARLAAAIGIDPDYARTVGVVGWCALALVSIDMGLRYQQSLLKEAAGIFQLPWAGDYPRTLASVGLASALLVYATGVDSPAGWATLGIVSLAVGGLSLAVVAVALAQLQRPPAFVLLASGFLALAAAGALVVGILGAVEQAQWGRVVAGVLFAATELWLMFEGLRKLRRAWPGRAA
jgi:carbon starvation protein